jgi:murein DD-endopeptidase MepM/ murein hydrolase activator NlpD
MDRLGKRRPFVFWNLCILGLFAAGCTSTEYRERVVREPIPTQSDSIHKHSTPIKKGVIIVGRGDTLYLLARRHGVALRGLIQANKLKPPYIIYPKQRLKMPVSRYHVVGKGQTVYQIARHYDIDMGSLVRINKIEPPFRVKPGERLRLPDSSISKLVKTHASAVQRTGGSARSGPRWVVMQRRPPSYKEPQSRSTKSRWSKRSPVPIKNPPPRTGRKFLWPLRGKVIESFGARAGGLHNDGINIAGRKGASIRAAENGVVAYTGNQLQGFGNLVLVKHSGGWMSAYAHSSIILVKRGDVVRRGQVIARVGRTGNVSRPQLHFELRRGDRAVNPKNYLVRIAQTMPAFRQFADMSFGNGH